MQMNRKLTSEGIEDKGVRETEKDREGGRGRCVFEIKPNKCMPYFDFIFFKLLNFRMNYSKRSSLRTPPTSQQENFF